LELDAAFVFGDFRVTFKNFELFFVKQAYTEMKSSKPGRARCQSALSRSSLRAEPPLAPCPGVRALAVASRGARCHAVSAPCHLGSRTTKPPPAFPPLSSFLRVWSRHALAITVAGAPNRARQESEDHVWFEDRWMVASLCDE
jgi:hypothetical protein